MTLAIRAQKFGKKVTLFSTAFVLAVSSLAASVPFILSQEVNAAPNGDVIVSPTASDGWYNLSASEGAASFVRDESAPYGIGALQLSTSSNESSKTRYARFMGSTSYPKLADFAENLSYYAKSSAGSSALPAFQMEVRLGGTNPTSSGYTTLNFEPVYNLDQQPIQQNTWQKWNVSEGKLWSTRAVSPSIDKEVFTYTLDYILENYPDAGIISTGVNFGSGAPNNTMFADGISFGGNVFDFEPLLTPIVNGENFNTHSGPDYHGLNVGFSINDDFGVVSSVKVDLYKNDELLVSNTHNQALLNLINISGEKHLSTPFVTAPGTYVEEYWSAGSRTWGINDKPTKAVVTVIGANGNGSIELTQLTEPNGWSFENVIAPAVPANLGSFAPSTGAEITNGVTKIDQIRNTWSPVVDAISYNYEFDKPGSLATFGRNLTATQIQGAFHNTNNSPEGVYAFRVQAVKPNGVTSAWSAWSNVTLDKSAPRVENISISPMYNNNIGGEVTITFNVQDNLSGVDLSKSRVLFADGPNTSRLAKESAKAAFTPVGGNTYKTVIDTRTFAQINYAGKYNLAFNLYDLAGNNTSTKPVEFRGILVDNSGPSYLSSSINTGDVIGADDAKNFSVFFSDDTGILSASLTLKNKTTNQQKSVTLTKNSDGSWGASIESALSDLGDGLYDFSIRSVDLFGRPRSNSSSVQNVTVDTTKPTLQAELQKTLLSADDSLVVNVTNASDTLSGVDRIEFKITPNGSDDALDGFEYTSNTLIIGENDINVQSLEEGTYRIYVRAFDEAQNKRNLPFKEFTIDRSAPEVNVSDINAVTVGSIANVSGSVQDPEAESVDIYLNGSRVGNAPVTAGAFSFALQNLPVGTHSIFVSTKDNAGNIGASEEKTVVVNNVVARAPIAETPEQTISTPTTPSTLTTNSAPVVVLPSSAGSPAAILGIDTTIPAADDAETADEDVAGVSSQNTLAQAVDTDSTDGTVLGLSWYWWLLIAAGAAAIAWWIIAGVRRRSAES